MENNLITVSASPHIQTKDTVDRIMYDVIIALIPAFLMSIYVFGIGALIITLVAVGSAIGFEYLIQKFVLKVPVTVRDGSALLTGLLLAFNLPTNLPIWMVIVGSLVAIGVAKLSFGGLGNNIFNPALVGRVFLLISFPGHMTSWPVPFKNSFQYTDAVTGATPLGILKEGLMSGEGVSSLMTQIPEISKMSMGYMGGSLGEVSAIALLIGGVYLLYRKVITWHIPVTILVTVALLTGVFYMVNPEQYASPVFHLMAGGVMLGAFYMATDMVTSPMTHKGMIVFAIGIGIFTVAIRLFGSYPEGISFAILVMNAFVPLIDTYFKPKRFGKAKAK